MSTTKNGGAEARAALGILLFSPHWFKIFTSRTVFSCRKDSVSLLLLFSFPHMFVGHQILRFLKTHVYWPEVDFRGWMIDK